MRKVSVLLAVVAALCFNNLAFAHAEHDEKPLNKAPQFKLESAKKKNGAIVYVKNRRENFPTAGATGTLTIVSGATSTEVSLHPSGANGMETKGDIKMVAGAKAQASITFADKSTANAVFVVK